MSILNVFSADIQQFIFSPLLVEVGKVLLVTIGWIGGLAAFVYWKDKHNKIVV
ncbi:MAG: hypothetical protein ABJB11_18140 [Ferruginibacter sp.]